MKTNTTIAKIAPARMRSRVTQSVSEIKKLHSEIIGAARMSLENAIRIGELLDKIKSELRHGEWLPWLAANVEFSQPTASNYMRIFRERDYLKLKSVSNLTDAYKQLAEPEIKPPSWAKPDHSVEAFKDAYGIVAMTAQIFADRGQTVTPEEYVELGFSIMEGRRLEVRFDKSGRVQYLKDGEWLSGEYESEDSQMVGAAA